MSTTTTPTAAGPALGQQRRPHSASRAQLASVAFLAILRRDVVVTGREFIPFLLQTLIQPLFFLFVFGKVLPGLSSAGGAGTAGVVSAGFALLLLPGIVGLTVMIAALQGVTLPLVLDLGFAREIDDRLLAPLPVYLVAVEKILFAALRGLVAGAVIFPLAAWILGSGYAVRSDRIPELIALMVLTAFAGACLGLFIGTSIKPEQIGLMFSLIFTPLIFMGCTYYPWSGLASIKWFQIATLFNPLTYASEGLRHAMVPPFHLAPGVSVSLPTLDMRWVLLALLATIIIFYYLGVRTFRRRVVS
ncbi:MAG: ABC transporter permease [Ktedonobacterales bacterium]